MMISKNIKAPQVPKYEEVRELEESKQEKLIRESYEMELDSYNSIGISRGYGPCLVGDMSNCRCSKEELERQKVQIELQREKEKLEAERKQREREEEKRLREELRQEEEKRRELEEKARKEGYKYFWEK